MDFSNSIIYAQIKGKIPYDMKWYFIGVYGPPEVENQKPFWNLLRFLKQRDMGPWLVLGDFNEILAQKEKYGGRLHPEWQLVDFKSTLFECDLCDLGFTKNLFT